MSKQRDPNAPQHLPGNDGAWFLKAVGLDRSATELGDVVVDGDSTSESVRELWEANGHGDQLNGWTPEALSKKVLRRRNYRWSIVIGGGVVLAALVVALVLWYPSSSERRADTRSAEYSVALSIMLTDLPDTQQALAVLTEPDADVSQFPALIPTITGASGDAADALEIAAAPLPRPWPMTPSAPFDELTQYRDAVSVDATTAEAITRRLGNLLDYRTVLEAFLDIDELPTTSSGVDVNSLTTELATATADAAAVIDELPDDAALADHKTAVEAALTRFSQDQPDYLEALRDGRDAEAEIFVAEYQALEAELDVQLVDALARMRREIDGALISLSESIEQTLSDLPG